MPKILGLNKKILLVIGLVWPEPKSSAAGTRILQLIGLFQKQNYQVVFASAAQESEFSFQLKSIDVKTQKIELNASTFDVFIQSLNPEIVLFDRFVIEEQFGWRVHENCPNAIRILDTEDLHCLRLTRQNAIKKSIPFLLEDLLISEIAKREISSILRCDLSLIISEFEMKILKDIFKINSNLLHYLPIFYDLNDIKMAKNFNQKRDFVFIGNFLHEPNWDAVKQLKEHIWPKIKKELPDAVLNIYGAYPSQKVMQLHNSKDSFLVHGRAENAQDVIKNARILLAPIRFGAGLKGKLLEAMQVGTPSISTTIGAEGINDNFNWNGFIEDNFDVFVTKAVSLYENETFWNNSQNYGFQILKNRFSENSFYQGFFNTLNQIIVNVDNHRKQNFIGSLLLHQNLLSTKYMSRWIEEKNKK